MKTFLVALAVAASVVVAVPAANASPACATRTEYSKVHQGQTLRKVRSIFGGREGYSYNLGFYVSKSWHKCHAGERYAQVDFKKGIVSAKRWTS